MPIATNDKGEALRLDQSGQWVPTQLATNPKTGERLALDGDKWTPIGEPKAPPNPIVDSARSVPGGLVKGVGNTIGFIGDAANLLNAGLNKVLPGYSSEPVPFTGEAVNKVLGKPTGGFYEPQTTAGRFTETAAGFAPAALGGEASVAQRVLGRVLAPAVGAETGGAVGKLAGHETAGRVLGSLLAGSPAGAAAAIRAGTRKLTSSVEPLAAEEAALVRQYEQMGGHLRPGQYMPGKFMRQGDSVISDTAWPRATGFAHEGESTLTAISPQAQKDEFGRFLSRQIGEDSPRLTESVLNRASQRISQTYETVLPRNAITQSEGLTAALGDVESNLRNASPAMDSADVTRVQNVLEALRRQVGNGSSMPGDLYQQWRKRGGLLDEMAGSKSPVVSESGTKIRRALDDAFVEQADPIDREALQSARAQYRALETLRPLANKAPTGEISPALLLSAVNREYGSPGRAGDLGTLARVGQAYLKDMPSSGTAERSVWRSIVNKPVTEAVPNALNSIVSLPVALAHSRQINRVINSPEMRARLLANALQDQGATAIAPGPNGAALANALRQKP